MYSLTKTKIKNFLVVLLTLVLALSVALFAACGDTTSTDGNDDEDQTTTEETITDYQVVKNGDFEFATTEKSKFPFSTSINWSRSTDTDKNSATASSVSSGIIDTEATAWAKLKDDEKPVDSEGNKINPGTPYSKELITSSNYDYEDEDKRVNPQVDGTKILMINNKSSVEGLGSAQKFKSSSTISVPVDSYAIISLWVRTDNIKLKSGQNGGAYVLITDRVGSTSYKNIEYRDINTNGKWEKIETVIKGSTFNSSTFTVTVGLGRGNGTFKADYVEGFAFFDNVEATIYSASEYKALNRTDSFKNADKNSPNYNYYTTPTTNNTLSYAYTYEYVKDADVTNVTPLANEDKGFNTQNILPQYTYDLSDGNEINKATVSTVTNETIKTAISDIKDTGLKDDASLIYFDFKRASTGYYTTGKIDIQPSERHYITLYAKTSVDNEKIKMAKISLINTTTGEETTTLSAFSSFTTTSVTDSAYGNWIKYSIFVNNPTDTLTDYKIKFTFGDDEDTLIGDVYKLQKGYAIFAGLNVETISEENYSLVSTSSNSTKISVYGKYSNYTNETTSSNNKDVYTHNTDLYGNFEIVNKPTTYIQNFIVKGNRDDVYTGLVNSKYNDNYDFLTSSEKQAFVDLKEEDNEHSQLIIFKNPSTVGTTQLLTTKKTIPANTIVKYTIKLRVLGDASAKIRLVESAPESDGNNLTYKSYELDAGDWKKELTSTVDNSSHTVSKWTEVCFYIAAGNETMSFRIEFSLEKAGTMFLHSIVDDAASFTSIVDLDNEIKILKGEFEDINLPLSKPLTHTRAPAKVLSTDEDGNEVESTRTFEPTEIYTSNNLYTFAKFNTIFADEEIDERTQDDTSTDEDTSTDDEDAYTVTTDLGLQISSLVLALALIAVLIVVVIRNFRKNNSSRKAVIKSYYSRDTRDEAMAKIAKKKAKIDVTSTNEGEYDYEEAEAIEESVEEDVEEISNEESSEEIVIDAEEITQAPEVETVETVIEADEISNEPETSSEVEETKTEE